MTPELPPMQVVALVIALVAVPLLGVACGNGDERFDGDERLVADAVGELEQALQDSDGELICRDLVVQEASMSQARCEKVFVEAFARRRSNAPPRKASRC